MVIMGSFRSIFNSEVNYSEACVQMKVSKYIENITELFKEK